MKRISRLAALAAAVALLAMEMAASGRAEPPKASKTIRVRSELTSMSQVDNEPAGPSAGDMLVFTERLRRQGKSIGEITGSAVLVRPPSLYEVTYTASLPGGRLAVSEHGDLGKEEFHGAITGGTGIYRRARGTVLVKVIAEGQEMITFHILD